MKADTSPTNQVVVPPAASPRRSLADRLPRWVFFYKRLSFEETFWGWIFISPVVLGLLFFKIGPVLASLALSFTKYDIITPPKFIGFDNFLKLPTDDLWVKSVTVTLTYTALFIPLSMMVAYLVAMLMSQELRGIAAYRTMWYLPSLVPVVVSAVIWRWALNPEFGPINYPLKLIGVYPPGWLTDPAWIIPSVVIIQVWAVGNTALIFLASIKGVPTSLYEAAEVDGAGTWYKFIHITIPMTSSVIFFQLIMAVIYSFQVFSVAYVLFGGATSSAPAGPSNSALFYVLYTFRNAFGYFNNGYASSMAWVLFVVVMILTWIIFKTQKRWVYYETSGEES